ncbi:hypothetical protein SPOG_04213 [Schizosaccharomyces cryophilus OY26]|uniref:Uncharacterized protein n=1 Tax=Schizosaccharomyces cryophilus (strain OY26 / ATCC MYA-4695 / CBS 11777 / NBRC 106824 / NRRL Y48691) TaxID=653667 RepID=S9XB10_SCHCR|nr:uncharacterized protein SPOG_04213 [Schizosaccharomyces cryophilus OY26]EPY54322.1 hypothetical protein SPOG_04213 [Schizosaccharomyces cryophilus OY26]
MDVSKRKPPPLKLQGPRNITFVDTEKDSTYAKSPISSPASPWHVSDKLISAIYEELKSPSSPWDKNFSQQSPWLLANGVISHDEESPLLPLVSPLNPKTRSQSMMSRKLSKIRKQPPTSQLYSKEAGILHKHPKVVKQRFSLANEENASDFRKSGDYLTSSAAGIRSTRQSAAFKKSLRDLEFLEIEDLSSHSASKFPTKEHENVGTRMSNAYSRFKSAVKDRTNGSMGHKRSKIKRNIQHLGLTEYHGWEHHPCDWL